MTHLSQQDEIKSYYIPKNKGGRPKSKIKSTPITIPVRVPIGYEKLAKQLPDIIGLILNYESNFNYSPRWYYFNKFLKELKENHVIDII